jgi:hypothetical protein
MVIKNICKHSINDWKNVNVILSFAVEWVSQLHLHLLASTHFSDSAVRCCVRHMVHQTCGDEKRNFQSCKKFRSMVKLTSIKMVFNNNVNCVDECLFLTVQTETRNRTEREKFQTKPIAIWTWYKLDLFYLITLPNLT